MHYVQRPFEGGGVLRERGEIVDTANWRTSRQLLSLRYLAPLPAGSDIQECNCGRFWTDADSMAQHACVKPSRRRKEAS